MGGRQVAIREILGLNLNRELCLKNYIIHMPKNIMWIGNQFSDF